MLDHQTHTNNRNYTDSTLAPLARSLTHGQQPTTL